VSNYAHRVRRGTFAQLLARTPLHPQWLARPRRAVLEWLANRGPVDALDVGCADRWLGARLAPGSTYVGLDSIATGVTRYKARPEVFGDGHALPFRNGAFDAVFLLEVLEHVDHPLVVLSEARRVLRSGGCVVVSVPFLYPIHDAPVDYRRFTLHGLEKSLEATGFTIEQCKGTSASLEAAALLQSIALAAAALSAWRRGGLTRLLVPCLLAAIPVVNLAGTTLARLAPDWSGMSTGYVAIGRAR
jgi:SAM-dependent methyltransferase